MEKFTVLEGIAAPLDIDNVDTDMIIPKQFLKVVKRTGLGKNLFDEMRFDRAGDEIPDFVLNREPYRQANILISGRNFGCGSSREHAPWSLADFGIRCVIAESFADIFYNNCFKNSILPVTLPAEKLALLREHAYGAAPVMKVDLEQKLISFADEQGNRHDISFEIEDARRETLLQGLDDIAKTLQSEALITEFEQRDAQSRPWLTDRDFAAEA